MCNLEWVSKKENIQHALKSGKMNDHIKNMSINNQGSKNIKAKLNELQIDYIKKQFTDHGFKNKTEYYKFMANKFGVSRGTISNIFLNKTWKHV